jgi:hypothetical protein
MNLTLNRARRDLLAAIDRGRVNVANGIILRHTRGAMNQRCDRDVRAFEEAGWVVLGADGGTYELTDAGRAEIAGGAR